MAYQLEGLQRVQTAMAQTGNNINTPPTGESGIMDSPGLEGSFQQLLAENLGHYVQIDFLVGVQTLVRRSGIIYAVGRSFVVLYDETNQNFVMCDVFSAKFVAFFATRPAPGVLPNNPMGIMEVDAQGNLWPVEDMAPAPNTASGSNQQWQTIPTQPLPGQTGPIEPGLQFIQQRQRQQQLANQGGQTPSYPPTTPQTGYAPGWVTLTDHLQPGQQS